MALRVMMAERGRQAPVLVCDLCRKPIADEADCIVMWFRPQGLEPLGALTEEFHLHRRCQWEFEARHKRGRVTSTAELDVHLHLLLWNVLHDERRAKQKADLGL